MTIIEAVEQLEEPRSASWNNLDESSGDSTNDEYATALADVALNALTGHTPEPSADVSPTPADETRAERLRDDDRRLFVRNLGWLLSQTRCGVVSCELYGDQDREYVIALYDHGGKREIDVTADSYLAIIRDVAKRV
jgi:hypothetical protein